jgi:hypothetical protein
MYNKRTQQKKTTKLNRCPLFSSLYLSQSIHLSWNSIAGSVSRRLAVPAPGYIAAHNNSINNTTAICILEYVKVTFDQRLTNGCVRLTARRRRRRSRKCKRRRRWRRMSKKSERKWMLEERRRRRKLCITGCLTKSSMLISKKKPVRSAFLTLNVFLTVNIRNDVSRLKFNNIREVIIIIQKNITWKYWWKMNKKKPTQRWNPYRGNMFFFLFIFYQYQVLFLCVRNKIK